MELISANLHIVDIYRRKKWKPDLNQYITADIFHPFNLRYINHAIIDHRYRADRKLTHTDFLI